MQANRSIAEDECVQDQIDNLSALPLLQKHCFLTHPTEMQKLRKGTMREFVRWSKRMHLASAKCIKEEQKGQQKIDKDAKPLKNVRDCINGNSMDASGEMMVVVAGVMRELSTSAKCIEEEQKGQQKIDKDGEPFQNAMHYSNARHYSDGNARRYSNGNARRYSNGNARRYSDGNFADNPGEMMVVVVGVMRELCSE